MLTNMNRFSMVALVILVACSCGRAFPSDAERRVDRRLLEGMYIVPIEWPDTLIAGAHAAATVQLRLANGLPYTADEVYWFSTDVTAAGLYPTSLPESKLVLAFAPDSVSVWVDAYVNKVPHPDSDDDYYHAELLLHLVVLPQDHLGIGRSDGRG